MPVRFLTDSKAFQGGSDPDLKALSPMAMAEAPRVEHVQEPTHNCKRVLNTLLTRSAPQTSTTDRRSANPTRQVVPSPGSMVAVRWLMRTTVPTTV